MVTDASTDAGLWGVIETSQQRLIETDRACAGREARQTQSRTAGRHASNRQRVTLRWRKQLVAQLELPVYVLHGSNKPGCRRRNETAAVSGLTLTEGEVKDGDETWAALRGSCTRTCFVALRPGPGHSEKRDKHKRP